jgi:hypothetical protein
VHRDQNRAPETISDTDDWLNWNWDLDNPNNIEADCMADVKCDIMPENVNEDPECAEQQDVSAIQNVPRLIWPARKSKRLAEKVSVRVNSNQMRWNNRLKKQ